MTSCSALHSDVTRQPERCTLPLDTGTAQLRWPAAVISNGKNKNKTNALNRFYRGMTFHPISPKVCPTFYQALCSCVFQEGLGPHSAPVLQLFCFACITGICGTFSICISFLGLHVYAFASCLRVQRFPVASLCCSARHACPYLPPCPIGERITPCMTPHHNSFSDSKSISL